MKPLNYYNELSAFNKQISYSNVQFLGIEYINDNPLLRFKLENGKQFRRQLSDNTMYYEHVLKEDDGNNTTTWNQEGREGLERIIKWIRRIWGGKEATKELKIFWRRSIRFLLKDLGYDRLAVNIFVSKVLTFSS